MEQNNKFSQLHFIEKLSSHVTREAGSNTTIIIAFAFVFLWLAWGPIVNYSEHWQWLIHTVTTIITFLMVFLIQKSQNKDAMAIQLKLNELIAAHEFASNRLVDVENMTEVELKMMQKFYAKLSAFTKEEDNMLQSHSIDEVDANHTIKEEIENELAYKNEKNNTTK